MLSVCKQRGKGVDYSCSRPKTVFIKDAISRVCAIPSLPFPMRSHIPPIQPSKDHKVHSTNLPEKLGAEKNGLGFCGFVEQHMFLFSFCWELKFVVPLKKPTLIFFNFHI